jgi:glycosyltransferase involved in cell wall biosynthesis
LVYREKNWIIPRFEEVMSKEKGSALLMPVFNDWDSAKKLIHDLEVEVGVGDQELTIFIIDDASTDPAPEHLDSKANAFEIRVIRISRNLGHQRAIFEGLRHIAELEFRRVLIMDADGEDTPSGASRLLSASDKHDVEVIVAKRGVRKESWAFRTFYRAHKALFRILVGKRLDFGNFSVLPIEYVRGLVLSSDAATNLPSTILRSGHPLIRVKVDRGTRYFGQSKMSFEKLVGHSFSALAVFLDQIMVRLTIFSLFSTFIAAVGIGAVMVIRLFSETVTPGWATAAVGLLLVIIIQVLTFVGLGTLISLNLSSMKNFYANKSESASIRQSQSFPKN